MNRNFTYCFYFFIAVTFFLGNSLYAQVRFQTVVNPREVRPDDYFQIDYVIENCESVQRLTPPSFSNFEVLQGPSESSSVSIFNGAVSQSKSISYILRGRKQGKFTIPGASALINGQLMRSNPVTISINKNAPQRSNSNMGMPHGFPAMPDISPRAEDDYADARLKPDEDASSKIASNVMVKLHVNKQKCFVGEPVLATYKLYSRIGAESRAIKIPSLNGFSVYDMEKPNNQGYTVERIKGKTYNVFTLRKSQLIPLQAGTYTLDPIEVENKVEFLRDAVPSEGRGRGGMQRMMDEFFGRGEPPTIEEHKLVIKSEPVPITVNPLPEAGRPESFTGAIGNFTVKSSMKKKVIKAGDVAEMELVIDGSGNLPMINAPHLELPESMQVFDPVVKEEMDNKTYPLKGIKIINYSFLVKEPGEYTIPAVKFSFFDPASASYKTITADSLTIQVKKANKRAASTAADTAATAPVIASGWTDIINREILTGAAIILFLIVLVIYLLVRLKKKQPAQPEKEAARQLAIQQADKIETAPVSLNAATLAFEEGRSQDFYSEINKTIREAIYRNTNTVPSQMTKFNMPFILREKGVNMHTIVELESIMKECEIALYTPIHEQRDMRNILERTERVIREL